MLRLAVDRDRPDDVNPELRRNGRDPSRGVDCYCGTDLSPDYNENYWSRGYPYLGWSGLKRPAPEQAGERLMDAARAVRNFLSYFV